MKPLEEMFLPRPDYCRLSTTSKEQCSVILQAQRVRTDSKIY